MSAAFVWMRTGFRIAATVGLVQAFLGFCLIATAFHISYIDDAFLILVFGGCSLFLFRSQPQFAAVFALIPSAYAESIMESHNWAVFPASLLIAPLIWLLLLQHPVTLQRAYHPLIGGAVAVAATVATLLSFSGEGTSLHPIQNSLLISYYLLLALGAAILTQRCFAQGLLKSPRTIIFAVSLAPLSLGILAALLLGVEALPLSVAMPMNCSLALAPFGTVLFELAQRRKHNQTFFKGSNQ